MTKSNTATMPPVKKREIFGWAMFDFANSSYTTVVITAIYSVFFVQYIVPEGSTLRDSYWSIAMICSTVLALVLSPLVGAICDFSGYKKRYLLGTTLICSIATAMLLTVEPGMVWWGIFLLTISNAAFMLSESLCASFLSELATKDNMGLISGLGWGIGYFGGLASLITVMLIVTTKAWEDVVLYIQQNQWAMVATGLFFLLSALPTFLLVRERAKPKAEGASLGTLWKAGLRSMSESLSFVKQHQVLFQFFIAFTVYMAGMDVVIKFVGIYATDELKFNPTEIISMFLILQFSAAGGAVLFGWLETRLGPKLAVLYTLLLWMVGTLSVIFLGPLSSLIGAAPKATFLGIALIAGTAIGATQSTSRAVVGLLAPVENAAQVFGFWGMFGRLATILGMSYGFVSDFLDSRRLALLVVLGFFAVGALLLLRIPFHKVGQDKGRVST